MSQPSGSPETLKDAIKKLEEKEHPSSMPFERELEKLQKALEELSQKASSAMDQGVDTAKKAGRDLDKRVHENPWLAIGIVAAIAFLLGLLINRRD